MKTISSYNSTILKRLQNSQMEIVDKIEMLSKKYGFTYWLEYGSAIGAARHQGFIPWDDDMDIGMLRADYKKMCDIPESEWGDMQIVKPEDDNEKHIRCFSQCIKKNTVFLSEEYAGFRDKDNNQLKPNICVDIFVYDYYDIEKYDYLVKETLKLKRLYMYSKVRIHSIKGDSIKKRINKFLKRCIHYVLSCSRVKYQYIYKNFIDTIEVNSSNNSTMICNFTTMPIVEMNASCMPVDNYLPVIYANFEGRKYPMPRCFDKLLREIYGDYMKLPPKNERHRKPPIEIDFGDGKIIRFMEE